MITNDTDRQNLKTAREICDEWYYAYNTYKTDGRFNSIKDNFILDYARIYQ